LGGDPNYNSSGGHNWGGAMGLSNAVAISAKVESKQKDTTGREKITTVATVDLHSGEKSTKNHKTARDFMHRQLRGNRNMAEKRLGAPNGRRENQQQCSPNPRNKRKFSAEGGEPRGEEAKGLRPKSFV